MGTMMNYYDLHALNNWTISMFNDMITAITLLKKEQSEIRDFVLQTRYAVDMLLASEGGICAVVHTHCCMFISDYTPNIIALYHIWKILLRLTSDSFGFRSNWLLG